MFQGSDKEQVSVAQRYAELWHAIQNDGALKRSFFEQKDFIDQIRNSLDRKASGLLPEQPEWIANSFSVEGVAFQSGATEILKLRHRDLASLHALKTIPSAQRDDVVLSQSLRREAEIGLRLRHPNLLETSLLLRLNHGRPGILMPWHPVSLASLPAETRFSRDDAVSLLRCVLYALLEMHQQGLVHCDVTPANVFLAGEPLRKAKLGDFGITIPIGARHCDFGIQRAGSPEFAAPEQLNGEKAHPAQDIYAFGKLARKIISKMDITEGALSELAEQCSDERIEKRPQDVQDILKSLET
ncbi:protein kinase [Agrobacterium larrymoorei]|uniref:Protein kinase n=1 Tax=Agrobacterium larrymoorei TaxID=160699 RepID=A0A4D7DV07_9HYPH|nr:serine/threonine protein kinase [Agrobacterium larrymoorei]QYA08949.1 protein kinase [Agrobacterium larrymoorei]